MTRSLKPFRPRRVIAPVDLFEPCTPAVETARALALRWNALLELVFVYPMPQAWSWPEEMFPVPLIPASSEAERRWAEGELASLAKGLPVKRVRRRAFLGPPAAALSELAHRAGPQSLIVMGTHGFAGVERALMGSVAEAVVRRSTAPVLVLRLGGGKFQPRRILAPWNLAPYADRGLRQAAAVARAFGAGLTVLDVAPRLDGGRAADPARRLPAVLGSASGVRLKMRTGEARQEILSEARSGRYDLIVLSAHRKPFWTRRALGSTVEAVLRHGSTAVLAVPSGKAG